MYSTIAYANSNFLMFSKKLIESFNLILKIYWELNSFSVSFLWNQRKKKLTQKTCTKSLRSAHVWHVTFQFELLTLKCNEKLFVQTKNKTTKNWGKCDNLKVVSTVIRHYLKGNDFRSGSIWGNLGWLLVFTGCEKKNMVWANIFKL